jgi:hypothetical protein
MVAWICVVVYLYNYADLQEAGTRNEKTEKKTKAVSNGRVDEAET